MGGDGRGPVKQLYKRFYNNICEKMGGWLGGEVINKSEGLAKEPLLDS